ncbi:MAG: DNA primase [Candidatus Cloacimonetes bacterium]|nr:DNA primase [Candidatus Cloacimonadota bacterium]
MDNSLIDQIRAANDIVDVVQSYIPLKHVGTNWRGICPFHNDTNPSFYVSQPKQIYKCFACGKAGNVITFVQEYDKLSFIEAVKKLALRVGIQIPERERTSVVSTKRQQLIEVYRSATLFFNEMLFAHGQNALDYLKQRSFSAQTAKDLMLGYALPSNKGLLNHLMKEGYGVSLLKESGLFGEYSGALQDIYRDRLIFPIHNNSGDVIAFGGRIMEAREGVGKYINSPGTEIYTKGKELYGLYKTKYNISKMDCSLVCEGYFDFLRLYENGFTNAVAALGTALTEDQVFLLNRFSSNTVLLYDGDTAGIKAAIRGGLACLGKGMQVKIATLPEGEDPDSFILNKGSQAMQSLIAEATDLIHFMASSPAIDSPVKQRIDDILDALRHLNDPIMRELYLKVVSEAFGITFSALLSSLKRGRSASTTKASVSPTQIADSDIPEERFTLIWALRDIESYKLLATELSADYFTNRLYKRIYIFLLEKLIQQDDIDAAALLDASEPSDVKDMLAELIFEEALLPDLNRLIRDLKLRKVQRDLEALNQAITSDPENRDLLQKKSELMRAYRMMTKKVVNKVLF